MLLSNATDKYKKLFLEVKVGQN